jgi:hypothetical protein
MGRVFFCSTTPAKWSVATADELPMARRLAGKVAAIGLYFIVE